MTPFDDLTIRLIHTASRYSKRTDEKIALCLTFIKVCVIKYSQMQNASEKFWSTSEKILKQPLDTRTLSKADYVKLHTETLEVRVNYFGLVEELNRFGRIFQKYQVTLPDYQRIKFYRDKMIEHREDYWNYLQSNMDGLAWHTGKLVVPYHVGQKNLAENRQALYSALVSEFEKFNVMFPISEGAIMPNDFAECVFSSLAQIEPIPSRKTLENLVNILFKIGFPVPIYDIEAYCNRLLSWLEEFLRNSPLITD